MGSTRRDWFSKGAVMGAVGGLLLGLIFSIANLLVFLLPQEADLTMERFLTTLCVWILAGSLVGGCVGFALALINPQK